MKKHSHTTFASNTTGENAKSTESKHEFLHGVHPVPKNCKQYYKIMPESSTFERKLTYDKA